MLSVSMAKTAQLTCNICLKFLIRSRFSTPKSRYMPCVNFLGCNPFDGFSTVNRGGEFEIKQVSIFGMQR